MSGGWRGRGGILNFSPKKSKFVQTSAEPRGGVDTRCIAHVVFCCPPPASWQTPANTTKLRHTSTAVRGRHLKQIFMADRGSEINRELNQTLLKRGEEEAEEKIGEPLQSLGSVLNFLLGYFSSRRIVQTFGRRVQAGPGSHTLDASRSWRESI